MRDKEEQLKRIYFRSDNPKEDKRTREDVLIETLIDIRDKLDKLTIIMVNWANIDANRVRRI